MLQRPKAVYLAFLALVLLEGWPERGSSLAAAMQGQTFAAQAISSLLAASLLLCLSLLRRNGPPNRQQGMAIVLLVSVPMVTTLLVASSDLQRPAWFAPSPWGLRLLAALAAPLWLALLSALQMSKAVVPRVLSGATIAALAGACLLLPGPSITLRSAREISATVLTVLVAILTVWTWSYASQALVRLSPIVAAAAACFVAGLTSTLLSLLLERPQWQHVNPREVLLPLCINVVLFTVPTTVLWYWLLRAMPLPAFSMQAIAAWFLPGLSGFFFFGFRAWRVDAAILLGVGGLIVGLRAGPYDDELTSLHVA